MEKQPKIEVPGSAFEKLLNAIAVLSYIGMVVYLFVQYGDLPDQVPVHYNGAGEVDRWGGRGQLFLLPFIGAGLWIGMTVIEKYPHTYNYVNLTEENAEVQYKNGRRMVNVLKNEILILFSFINIQNIRVATGTAEGLGAFFLPAFLLIVFGSVLFFISRMLRN